MRRDLELAFLALVAAAGAGAACGGARSETRAAPAGSGSGTPTANRVVVDAAATTHDLLEALRAHARAHGGETQCYIAVRQHAEGVPELTFGAGAATSSGAFACDPAVLSKLLAGRAVAVEEYWIDIGPDSGPRTEALLQYYGSPGKGYIGRSRAFTGVLGPAAESVKHLESLAGDTLILVVIPLDLSAREPAPEDEPGRASAPEATEPASAPNSPPAEEDDRLTWDEVIPVIEKRAADLRGCFAPGRPAGAISLDVMVGRDGAVSDVLVLGSTLPEDKHADCVASVIRSLVFPAPRSATPLTISLPLVFSRPE